MSDYYEILGVSRDASTDDIKKAYRKLARELHPDVNSEPGAEDRFKEVGRAYETLSNPEKRQVYDMGGDPNGAGGGFGPGFGFTDIFETFFGAAAGAQRGPTPRQRRGQDALIRIEVDLGEATFGGTRELQIECLPTDIPEKIVVDVTPVGLGKHLRVSDLKLAENIRVVTDPDVVIVHVVAPRAEVAAAAEGEAAAAGAEPEVIKKGKAPGEGEAKAEAKPEAKKAEKKEKK